MAIRQLNMFPAIGCLAAACVFACGLYEIVTGQACLPIGSAQAATPAPVEHSRWMPASHDDYSKCPDPTLPSVSCQTPVSYGTCQVYSYGESGIREFVCDRGEPHAFPSGLDTYLSVNDAQTVSSMVQIEDAFACPYHAGCDTFVVVTQYAR